MLVLSIGLLGLASMQAQSMRMTTDSFSRDQASVLASGIIDRIRDDRDRAADYVAEDLGTLYVALDTSYTKTIQVGEQAIPYCANNPTDESCCDPAGTTVKDNLRCWLWQVKTNIPGSVPSITASDTDGFVDISLYWPDREPRKFDDESRLPENKAECEALTRRTWNAGESNCYVSQVWPFRP